jgi:hypothetical protein
MSAAVPLLLLCYVSQDAGGDGNLVMENGGRLLKHFEHAFEVLESQAADIRSSYTNPANNLTSISPLITSK